MSDPNDTSGTDAMTEIWEKTVMEQAAAHSDVNTLFSTPDQQSISDSGESSTGEFSTGHSNVALAVAFAAIVAIIFAL